MNEENSRNITFSIIRAYIVKQRCFKLRNSRNSRLGLKNTFEVPDPGKPFDPKIIFDDAKQKRAFNAKSRITAAMVRDSAV